ncbi:MAG: DUF3329 domain-containing protein [Cucumibacter sp.]
MRLISERDRAFFKPLWRRVAVVAFCAVWAGVEFFLGDPTWAAIVAGIGVLAAWLFLVRFDATDEGAKK